MELDQSKSAGKRLYLVCRPTRPPENLVCQSGFIALHQIGTIACGRRPAVHHVNGSIPQYPSRKRCLLHFLICSIYFTCNYNCTCIFFYFFFLYLLPSFFLLMKIVNYILRNSYASLRSRHYPKKSPKLYSHYL